MKEITLYSTGCPKCQVLKEKLSAKNVKYAENNSIEEMEKLNITRVPVLGVDGKLLEFREAIDWINGRENS